MYEEPISITVTITRNIKKAYYYYYYFPDYYYYFPLLLHLLLLLNQRNTAQADYKVTFKDHCYFRCITHYYRHYHK